MAMNHVVGEFVIIKNIQYNYWQVGVYNDVVAINALIYAILSAYGA